MPQSDTERGITFRLEEVRRTQSAYQVSRCVNWELFFIELGVFVTDSRTDTRPKHNTAPGERRAIKNNLHEFVGTLGSVVEKWILADPAPLHNVQLSDPWSAIGPHRHVRSIRLSYLASVDSITYTTVPLYVFR